MEAFGTGPSCAVVTCEEELGNSPHLYNQTISSMSIDKSRSESRKNALPQVLVVLNQDRLRVLAMIDKRNVSGWLQPTTGQVRLELSNLEDCSAKFTCRVEVKSMGSTRQYKTHVQLKRKNKFITEIVHEMKFLSKQMTTKSAVFSDKLENDVNAFRAKLIEKFGKNSSSSCINNPKVNSQRDDNSGNQPKFSDSSNNSKRIATRRTQQKATGGDQSKSDGNNEFHGDEDNTQPVTDANHTCGRGLAVNRSDGDFPYRMVYPSVDSVLSKPYLCDDTTDQGGWIIIQRRVYGNEDFNRDWADYRAGFGDRMRDFWMGNEDIYALTSSGRYELRVEVLYKKKWKYASYASFSISSEKTMYRLNLGAYSGTAGDCLGARHNGQMFSTFDKDNDSNLGGNCAEHFSGGWWFFRCLYSNLNGMWRSKEINTGLIWMAVADKQSLDASVMKIRKLEL